MPAVSGNLPPGFTLAPDFEEEAEACEGASFYRSLSPTTHNVAYTVLGK